MRFRKIISYIQENCQQNVDFSSIKSAKVTAQELEVAAIASETGNNSLIEYTSTQTGTETDLAAIAVANKLAQLEEIIVKNKLIKP